MYNLHSWESFNWWVEIHHKIYMEAKNELHMCECLMCALIWNLICFQCLSMQKQHYFWIKFVLISEGKKIYEFDLLNILTAKLILERIRWLICHTQLHHTADIWWCTYSTIFMPYYGIGNTAHRDFEYISQSKFNKLGGRGKMILLLYHFNLNVVVGREH